MLNKYLLTLLVMMLQLCAAAQKIVGARGEFQMKVESNMTLEQARDRAIHMAQINAIESVFGRSIVQNNSTYIENKNSGKNVETNSSFNFISNSAVNGEWLEDLDEPRVEKIKDGEDLFISAKVHGKVRELSGGTVEFDCFSSSTPDKKFKTNKFNNGQSFYLYFKSAQNGFVSVYTTDPELRHTFMLLPYRNSKNKIAVPVEADKEYYFFSKKHDYFNERENIDEQEMFIPDGTQQAQQQIHILFSPEDPVKPVLSDKSKELLDDRSLKLGYSLPLAISNENFQNWLQNCRVRNKKLQYTTFFITTTK